MHKRTNSFLSILQRELVVVSPTDTISTGGIVQNKKLFTNDEENLQNSSCEYILLRKKLMQRTVSL